MLADALTRTDVAIYLGIYASIVSTAAGLWALFTGIFRDRARITVKVNESYLVRSESGPVLVRREDTLETTKVTDGQANEVLAIVVRNRGRRPCRIENVAQIQPTGSKVFSDLANQIPFDLAPETSLTLLIGGKSGYRHGDIAPHSFYVVDGAGRVHPLRFRYGFHITFLLYGWAVRLYYARKRRRLRRARS